MVFCGLRCDYFALRVKAANLNLEPVGSSRIFEGLLVNIWSFSSRAVTSVWTRRRCRCKDICFDEEGRVKMVKAYKFVPCDLVVQTFQRQPMPRAESSRSKADSNDVRWVDFDPRHISWEFRTNSTADSTCSSIALPGFACKSLPF